MTKTIHIVPVGFTKEKLIDSLKNYPFQRVYLLRGSNPNLEGENTARETARKMKDSLKSVVEVKEAEVDKEDVFESAKTIVEIIMAEQSEGNKVMLNVTGSMRTVGIACYLAASMTGAEVYAGVSDYDEKRGYTGIKNIIKVPPFPIRRISEGKQAILEALNECNGEVDSLEDIITTINSELIPGVEGYERERSRTSYLVKELEKDSLVESEKSGKMLKVRLSKLGEIYAIAKTSGEVN